MFSKREENNNCVFAAKGLEYPDTDKKYTDLTGSFPVTNKRGLQYILILYEYDTNEILVEPIKTRSDADMLRAYTFVYETLENEGHAPKLNIMDNESSTVLNSLLQKIEWWYN